MAVSLDRRKNNFSAMSSPLVGMRTLCILLGIPPPDLIAELGDGPQFSDRVVDRVACVGLAIRSNSSQAGDRTEDCLLATLADNSIPIVQ